MWRRFLMLTLLLLLAGCGPKRCVMGVPNPFYDPDVPPLYETLAIADEEPPPPTSPPSEYVAEPVADPVKPARASPKPPITRASTPPQRPPRAGADDHTDVDQGFNLYPDEPAYTPPRIQPRSPSYYDRSRRDRDDYVTRRAWRDHRVSNDRRGRRDRGRRHVNRHHDDMATSSRGRRARDRWGDEDGHRGRRGRGC